MDHAGLQHAVSIWIDPLLNHALATEVGVFDYSLAQQARATALKAAAILGIEAF